jgi:hypothetical protein
MIITFSIMNIFHGGTLISVTPPAHMSASTSIITYGSLHAGISTIGILRLQKYHAIMARLDFLSGYLFTNFTTLSSSCFEPCIVGVSCALCGELVSGLESACVSSGVSGWIHEIAYSNEIARLI